MEKLMGIEEMEPMIAPLIAGTWGEGKFTGRFYDETTGAEVLFGPR